jgi:hypothetical protein
MFLSLLFYIQYFLESGIAPHSDFFYHGEHKGHGESVFFNKKQHVNLSKTDLQHRQGFCFIFSVFSVFSVVQILTDY